MDVIGHDYPRVHLIVSKLDAVLERSQNQFSNARLPEEHRPAPGLIEKAVHGNEGFAGGDIRGSKRTMCRKTIVQAERDKQGLADDFEMGKPTPSYQHSRVVWQARRHSPVPGGLRGRRRLRAQWHLTFEPVWQVVDSLSLWGGQSCPQPAFK
ncbi:MAG: hypothetical protein ABSA48_16465, partial [Terracidiphilus sp.]